jgi:HK97 family phage portal protein
VIGWLAQAWRAFRTRAGQWELGWPGFGWLLPTLSGEPVTAQRASGHSAVYSCLRLISNAVGSPEWSAIVRKGAGSTLDETSAQARALDTLDVSERVACVFDFLAFGNSYIRIWRDVFGQVEELERLPAAAITVKATEAGVISYEYFNPYSGVAEALTTADIIQLRNLCTGYWPAVGVSGLASCAETVGLALSLDTYRGSALRNGSLPSGYLATENKIDRAKAAEIGERWSQNFGGGLMAGRTPVLEQGLKYNQLRGSTFQEMLLPEAARLSIGEVARIFNLSPSLIGETLQVNRSTAQTEFEEAHRLCFKPIAAQIAEQLARQLFTRNQRTRGHWIEISLDEWLRGAGQSLADAASKLILCGAASLDDARSWFHLPPLPNGLGALPWRPVNMVGVDAPQAAAAAPASLPAAAPAPRSAPEPEPGSTVVIFPKVAAGTKDEPLRRPLESKPALEALPVPARFVASLSPLQAVFPPEAPDLGAEEPEGPNWIQRMNAALADGNMVEAEMLLAEEITEPPVPAPRVASVPAVEAPSSPPPPPPTPVEREALMAQISAEIYAHLARGILPMCAEATAAIRLEAIEQRREFLAEVERLKELERAGRVLAAREEREAEAEEEKELATFRARLAVTGLNA